VQSWRFLLSAHGQYTVGKWNGQAGKADFLGFLMNRLEKNISFAYNGSKPFPRQNRQKGGFYMSPRAKENVFLYYGIAAVFLLLLAAAFAFDGDKEPFEPMAEYKNVFHIALPQSAKLLHSESEFGWFGDGHALYIFELTPEDMKTITENLPVSSWFPLPLASSAATHLRELDMARPIRGYGGLSSDRGYYLFLDNAKPQRRHNSNTDLRDYYFSILDAKNNRIHFLIFRS
jgi:hypothetical protein